MDKGIKLETTIEVVDLPVKQVVGNLTDVEGTFAIVVSRFNDELTTQLVKSAVHALLSNGVTGEDVTVVWVPGAYEIPAAAGKLLAKGVYDAVIGLGVVIQGATQHAQLINQHVALALGNLSLEYGIPVIYEIISALNIDDATARCAGGPQSRGWYAGLAALEMVQVYKQIG